MYIVISRDGKMPLSLVKKRLNISVMLFRFSTFIFLFFAFFLSFRLSLTPSVSLSPLFVASFVFAESQFGESHSC
jgi:hypothetical protein